MIVVIRVAEPDRLFLLESPPAAVAASGQLCTWTQNNRLASPSADREGDENTPLPARHNAATASKAKPKDLEKYSSRAGDVSLHPNHEKQCKHTSDLSHFR
jgi:hypothetical protein